MTKTYSLTLEQHEYEAFMNHMTGHLDEETSGIVHTILSAMVYQDIAQEPEPEEEYMDKDEYYEPTFK